MQPVAPFIEWIVLCVHRRNGGTRTRLDFSLSLQDPQLLLDRSDFADVKSAIEREFQCAPFDVVPPPRTWADLLRIINEIEEQTASACAHKVRTANQRK